MSDLPKYFGKINPLDISIVLKGVSKFKSFEIQSSSFMFRLKIRLQTFLQFIIQTIVLKKGINRNVFSGHVLL